MTAVLKSVLAREILAEEVNHAYIFTGEQGETQAISFAMSLNCLHREEDGNACGVCLSCRKIKDLNHPDLFLIEPDRGYLRIEQTRALLAKIALEKFEGAYKIIIFKGCESLRDEAANNLLKTLEEPPENTVFILLTAAEGKMLATIRSRCRIIHFESEAVGFENDNQRICMERAAAFLRELPELPLYRVLAAVAEWEKDRAMALEFCTALLEVLMQSIKANFGQSAIYFVPCRPDLLLIAAEQAQKATEQLNANVNIRACLDMLFLRLWSCMKQGLTENIK